jgi:hypothetical protein
MEYKPGNIVVRTTYESDPSGIQVGDILKIEAIIINNTVLVVRPIKSADKFLEGLSLYVNVNTVSPKIILKRKTNVV